MASLIAFAREGNMIKTLVLVLFLESLIFEYNNFKQDQKLYSIY